MIERFLIIENIFIVLFIICFCIIILNEVMNKNTNFNYTSKTVEFICVNTIQVFITLFLPDYPYIQALLKIGLLFITLTWLVITVISNKYNRKNN